MRSWWQKQSPERRREIIAKRDKTTARARDLARNRTPERRAYRVERTREWRRRNPHKDTAHQAVGRAIETGTLVRQPCEVCGALQTHAHHDDYTKPLEVRWLCPLHHKTAVHR